MAGQKITPLAKVDGTMKGGLTLNVGLAYATLHVLAGGFKSFSIFTPTKGT